MSACARPLYLFGRMVSARLRGRLMKADRDDSWQLPWLQSIRLASQTDRLGAAPSVHLARITMLMKADRDAEAYQLAALQCQPVAATSNISASGLAGQTIHGSAIA